MCMYLRIVQCFHVECNLSGTGHANLPGILTQIVWLVSGFPHWFGSSHSSMSATKLSTKICLLLQWWKVLLKLILPYNTTFCEHHHLIHIYSLLFIIYISVIVYLPKDYLYLWNIFNSWSITFFYSWWFIPSQWSPIMLYPLLHWHFGNPIIFRHIALSLPEQAAQTSLPVQRKELLYFYNSQTVNNIHHTFSISVRIERSITFTVWGCIWHFYFAHLSIIVRRKEPAYSLIIRVSYILFMSSLQVWNKTQWNTFN